MSYTDEELIEHVNAQIRRDEELHRETLECLEVKKALHARQTLRKIVTEQSISLTDEEFEQAVQESLRFMDTQPVQCTIVVNEIQLGGE